MPEPTPPTDAELVDDLRAYAGRSEDHAYVPAELLRVVADRFEAFYPAALRLARAILKDGDLT